MGITAGAILVTILTIVLAFLLASGRPRRWNASLATPERSFAAAAWDPERIFIYALSFAGLMATLYAVAGLAATLVVTVTQHSGELAGNSSSRDRTSYYLASIVVGAPVWLGLWRLAQRRVTRLPGERDARERRWYLAAIFAVTAVVALFGVRSVLQNLLSLPGAFDETTAVRDAIFAGARVLVWGGAWLLYARVGWRERSPRDLDSAHDIAVYVLSGFALIFLAVGLVETGHRLIGDELAAGPLPGGNRSLWRDWADMVSLVVAGGLFWGAIWRYDVARGGRRLLRVYYLYLVVAVAAFMTIGTGTDCLYEIARRIFGYTTDNTWRFLQDVLPQLVVGGALWAYHWGVIRRQPATAADAGIPPGAIRWPRHTAIVLLDLVGLVMAATGLVLLLWLLVDALLRIGTSGADWWRDQLSAGLALTLAGGTLWLPAWLLLQRSAAVAPERERTIGLRFRLLGLITLAGTLIATGFTVAFVWTIFRTVLNGTFNASAVGWLLKDAGAVLVTLAVAGYHAVYLRRERNLQPRHTRTARVLALAVPGSEATLTELTRSSSRTIELLGRIGAGGPADASPEGVEARLAAIEAEAGVDGALLIVRPDGVTVYPYSRATVEEIATRQDTPLPSVTTMSGPESGESAITPA